jgi:hypothetical protein
MRAFRAGGFLAGWKGIVVLAGLTLSGFGVAAVAQGAPAPGLLKVRLGGDQIETRVVVDLDRSVVGKLVSDGADGRIVLSLPRIDAPSDLRGAGQGLVRRWHVERAGGSATMALLASAVAYAAYQVPVRELLLLSEQASLALLLFLLGMIGLGVSMWPHVVPPSITIWQAAAPPRDPRIKRRGRRP